MLQLGLAHQTRSISGDVGLCSVPPVWAHADVEESVMSRQRVSFVGALVVLIVGAAGTDALLARALPPDESPGPGSDREH